MSKIQIINKIQDDTPFLILKKYADIPSAPLFETDENNALSMAIKIFPQIKNVVGDKKIEYGLLHRIDNATEGLLLIALKQEFYDEIKKEQKNDNFIKFYKATCQINGKIPEGFENPPIIFDKNIQQISIQSYFKYYGEGRKTVRPVSQNASNIQLKKVGKLKLYTTNVEIQKIENEKIEVLCSITQGFKHQVRAHLAWCNLPIIGDKVYNLTNNNDEFKFEATGLKFKYKNQNYEYFI